jgi:hypothetical protein
MLDNPGRRRRHIEARMREQGHKTPHGPQDTRRLPYRPGSVRDVLQRHTRNHQVELAIIERLQARAISHVIGDAKLLLRLALPGSNDDWSRGIHTRNVSAQAGELTGESAIAATHIEDPPRCQRTQHPEEGWMKQIPMPVATLVSFVFIPTFRHVLPAICGRHVNHPSYSSHTLRAMEFVPKHEIDGSQHT